MKAFKKSKNYISLFLIITLISIIISNQANPQADEVVGPLPTVEFPGTMISGKVSMSDGSQPENLILHIGKKGAIIDSDGSYVIYIEEPNTYHVMFSTLDGSKTFTTSDFEGRIAATHGATIHRDFILEPIESTPSPSPSPSTSPVTQGPEITRFVASKTTVQSNEAITLTWTSSRGTLATLTTEPAGGTRTTQSVSTNGNRSVTPAGSTIYGLTVTNATGQSDTETVTVVVSNTPAPPATPTNLQIRNDGTNQLQISWQDRSSNEKEFYLYRSDTRDGTYVVDTPLIPGVSSSNTTVRITRDHSINANQTYYYKVSAYREENSYGSESAKTDPVEARLTPIQPIGWTPNLLRVRQSGNNLRLDWGGLISNEIDGIEIWRSESTDTQFARHGSVVGGTTISAIDSTALKRRTTYYYKVRAFKTIRNELQYTPFSNVKSGKTK